MRMIENLGMQYATLNSKRKYPYAIYECPICGNNFRMRIRIHPTKSCGCLWRKKIKEANTKHGMHHTRLYRIWTDMRTRCSYKSHKSYYRYGGRGIRICNEWLKFESFMEWALSHGYKNNLTIDRIDNDGNYDPDNCRWATSSEQELNKKKTGEEGVCFISRSKKWRSSIKRNRITTYLGHFSTKEEAIKVRNLYMLKNNIK